MYDNAYIIKQIKTWQGLLSNNNCPQFNTASSGFKRDQTAGRGGSAVHGDTRGVSAQRTEARQHRHVTRHRPHEGDVDVRL